MLSLKKISSISLNYDNNNYPLHGVFVNIKRNFPGNFNPQKLLKNARVGEIITGSLTVMGGVALHDTTCS